MPFYKMKNYKRYTKVYFLTDDEKEEQKQNEMDEKEEQTQNEMDEKACDALYWKMFVFMQVELYGDKPSYYRRLRR
jgi:hypothetical protein